MMRVEEHRHDKTGPYSNLIEGSEIATKAACRAQRSNRNEVKWREVEALGDCSQELNSPAGFNGLGM
ncbi:hypothetical protein L1D34_26585 [Vibrio mediterranei]|uniref:hypothetical protein n=1 Tax=Vibrio mediterranei TaxID=689 RepID=UPI001EFE60CD|nr:hypothetical protein [Vibrio mediterranei]MCG9628389.1 hypothetical protein [Vibrio mediterranei]